MPAIVEQKQADAARKRLLRPDRSIGRRASCCYLCGNPLPPLEFVGRRGLVRVEHVIPESVCGEAPTEVRDRWRITAEVHKECDKKYKSGFDERYQAIEFISTADPSSWSPQQTKIFGEHVGSLKYLSNGRLVGTIENIQWIHDAVWTWVRGCHSLLHGIYLPISMAREVISPFEMFSSLHSSSFKQQIAEQAEMRSIAAGICSLAEESGSLNTIRCWGGKVEFLSAWVHISPSAKGRAGWPICVWLLSTPLLGAFCEAIRGSRVPWSGIYHFPGLPTGVNPVPRSLLVGASGYRKQVKEAAERLLPGLYDRLND